MKMANTQALTFTCNLHRQRQEHGRLVLRSGAKSAAVAAPVGRVPRISRLMALALRFEDLLRRGEVKDYAELARLGHVTRARVTQTMNLLLLAPDIQEAILFLPLVESGHDPIKEWQVRPIAAEANWTKQRRLWRHIQPR
jgi:hypothetical protein